MDGHEVGHGYDHRRGDEQLLVGKAELHAEEHGEVDGHAGKTGIEQHHQVFYHEVGGTLDGLKRTQVHTARELDAERTQHIYPRPDAPWHPVAEHGHIEAHACCLWGRRHWYHNRPWRRNQYFTSHSTLYPACRRARSSALLPSRAMRTVTRCSTLTKLPVALSTGRSEKALPVARLMRSTRPR